MILFLFLLLALIQLLFLIMGVRLYLRNRSIYTAIAAAVILGLFYDNFIIVIGTFVGEGETLKSLNAARFALHALLTPLLIMFAVATAQRLQVGWAQKRIAFSLLGILTVGMIILGVYTDIIQLTLVPEMEFGTLRYVDSAAAGPPIPSIVTIIVMIVVGAFIWRQHNWSVLFIGATLMFLFAGAGASLLWAGNLGEVLFAGSIVWTDYRLGDLAPAKGI